MTILGAIVVTFLAITVVALIAGVVAGIDWLAGLCFGILALAVIGMFVWMIASAWVAALS